MAKLIEQLALNELKVFMKKDGHQLEFDEINGGPKAGGHYLVGFMFLDIPCFIYYEAVEESDPPLITSLCLEAFFNQSGIITPEDINEINCLPISGRLSIKPTGSMTYALMISLEGGVTEAHLEHQLATWKTYVSRCKEFVTGSEYAIKQLKARLDEIISDRNSKN